MKGKVLAIDYGTKRVGVASGDLEYRIAFPREIIENKGKEFLVGKILELCKKLEISKVIVGLPLTMEKWHKENPVMKDVVEFVELLKEKGIVVELFDERLSSFEAEEMTGKMARKGERVDAHAAQVILQRWFDAL